MAYLLSLACGILSEVVLFSRGEWDRHAPQVLKAFAFLAGGSVVLFWKILGLSIVESVQGTVLHGAILLVGLFGSMVGYRLFFHPLRCFPGPFAARVTSLWVFKESIPDLKFHLKLRGLHAQFGDFVRIRPREISVCNVDAIVHVHGHRNKMQKGEFYDQIYPYRRLQMARDPAVHNQKCRYWDRAFHAKSLNEYVPRLRKHYGTLMGILSHHADVSEYFMFLGFDLVSELLFGEPFNMLSTGQPNELMGEFIKRKKFVGFSLLSMWLYHLLIALPGAKTKIQIWLTWYEKALDKREEMAPEEPDFYTHLSKSETFHYDRSHEATLAVVAGSDTVATTLTNISYMLCRYPEYQRKLYEEVGFLPDDNGLIDDRLLQDKPLLLGIINETLRLHPPVPSGMQRVTPPEGAVIAGRFIPGNMIVTTPTYALQRDACAFVKPNYFIPERWSSQPGLILRKDAFFPFSYGTFNCAGKPMAMMELRMVTSMVIKRFSLSFASGKEAECEHFIQDQADCFITDLHPLPVVLKDRSAA